MAKQTLIVHIVGGDAEERKQLAKRVAASAPALGYEIVHDLANESLSLRRLDLVAFAKQGAPPAMSGTIRDEVRAPAPRLREVPIDLGSPIVGALRGREAAFNE